MLVDIETLSIVIAAVTVVVGVIYSSLQLREQTRSRHTDLVMRLYDKFSSDEFQDAWYRVRTSDIKKLTNVLDQPKELFQSMNQVCLFFEGVGILLRRGITDVRMIDDLFGETVIRAWELMKTTVDGARQQLNDPEVYYCFEFLYDEMKKREQLAHSAS